MWHQRPRFEFLACLLGISLSLPEPSFAQSITTDAAIVRPPQRNGFFADLDITRISRVEWLYKSEKGVSAPTVANGMVYCSDDDHVIHAKSARGGLSVWQRPIQQRVYRPVVADRRHIYVATDSGVLALTADGGEPSWHVHITGGTGEIVLWRPTNTLFVGGADGWLRAIDSGNGEEKWKASLVNAVPDDPEGFDGERARIGNNPCRPSGIATDGSTVFQNIFDQSRVIAFDHRDRTDSLESPNTRVDWRGSQRRRSVLLRRQPRPPHVRFGQDNWQADLEVRDGLARL